MKNREDFRNKIQFPSVNDQLDHLFGEIQESHGEEKYEEMVNYSRSLVESTCKFIYFYMNRENLKESNLNTIVKKTLKVLKLNVTSPFYEKLRNIINEVGIIRDRNNISHGIRRKQENLGENEAWLYTVLCVDFCKYLLGVFYSQNVNKNIIGGLIDPLDKRWVDFKSNDGFKIQVRDYLKQYFIGYATITIDKDVELKQVVEIAENSINELLPDDISWESRKQVDPARFQLSSEVFERNYEIKFDKIHKGWIVYLTNINSATLTPANSKYLFKYPFKVESFYNLNDEILKYRFAINNYFEKKDSKLIRTSAKGLIEKICLEISRNEGFEKPKGDIQEKVSQVVEKLNPSRPYLLKAVLNELLSFIKFPKLDFTDKLDYLIYAFFVDDLCLYLMKLENNFLANKNNTLKNVIGGILEATEFCNIEKVSECEYIVINDIVNTKIYLFNEKIKKVSLSFKVPLDKNDEFVTEKIRDYLPNEVEFKGNISSNQAMYALNEKISYNVSYISKKELFEVIIK